MDQAEAIFQAVCKVLPRRRPIEHHEALVPTSLNLHDLLGATYLNAFTGYLKHATNAEHVVLTSSGTAALHIALLVAGVKPGDEVIVPNTTFAGTANAIIHAGAVPHFLDCGLSISPHKLKQYLITNTEPANGGHGCKNRSSGRPITAIIPVHLFGIPASITDIVSIAAEFGLSVVEDSAQSLGSRVNGRQCGLFGKVGILSFNNNKIVTTNGGGAIITNDRKLADKAHTLVNTARIPHPWLIEHTEPAWNYRMGNINAAFGLPQLEAIDEIFHHKARLADRYREEFCKVGGVSLLGPNDLISDKPNNWLISIKVDPEVWNRLIRRCHADGIRVRASFTPLHTLHAKFRECPRNAHFMLESEDFFRSTICLPSGPGLVEER